MGRTVANGAVLDVVPAAPSSDEIAARTGHRIEPRYTPRLQGRVPHPQGSSVGVACLVRLADSIGSVRHDPYVLYRAAFQHPGGVYLGFETAGADVHPIMADIEIPASRHPSLKRLGFWHLRRSARA